MNYFTLRLKAIMKENNVTNRKLAKAIFMNENTISGYRTSRVQPTLDKLILIADYFDVDLDYLVGRMRYKQ